MMYQKLKEKNGQRKLLRQKNNEVLNMKCPACGIGPEWQKPVKNQPDKSQCTGCGTIFFNKEKLGFKSGVQ